MDGCFEGFGLQLGIASILSCRILPRVLLGQCCNFPPILIIGTWLSVLSHPPCGTIPPSFTLIYTLIYYSSALSSTIFLVLFRFEDVFALKFQDFPHKIGSSVYPRHNCMNLWRDVEGETNVWRRRRMTTWSGAAINAILSSLFLFPFLLSAPQGQFSTFCLKLSAGKIWRAQNFRS